MAYILGNINFADYGISAGRYPGSNIALSGCFDMPARMGITERDWGDEDGIEPYVESDEIFFEGRDILFAGWMIGTQSVICDNILKFNDDLDKVPGLRFLTTPYGNFNVLLKSLVMDYYDGGANVLITFREPVVDLTGGILPAVGTDDNTIDGIPFSSFGFYTSKKKGMGDIPEMKPMAFTLFGAEGYSPAKRNERTLEIEGFVIGTTLLDFIEKMKALYLIFSTAGFRAIKINGEEMGVYYLKKGFKVNGIIITD